MRLTALTLTNYGIFESERIAFAAEPGRINLLIAPNGAGKSILRTAFCDLLFGIGGQTPMGFRYGYPNMRLMAQAVAGDRAFAFGRRKGTGNTLIDADGERMEPAALTALLGATDRTLLERLFALDTEKLREGGQALLASGGQLADALLSAAGGLRQARDARVQLEAARDRLAPERKSQGRPFYQALERLLDARKRLAATTLKPEVREKQEADHRRLHNERHEHAGRQRSASAEMSRLERVRRVRGALAAYDSATAWLAAHDHAPMLPEDAGPRLEEACNRVGEAERLEAHEVAGRDRIAAERAQEAGETALVECAEEIEALVERTGAMRKAAADIPGRQGEHDAIAMHIASLLRALGSPVAAARAAEAIPPLAAVARARQLLSDHDRLRAELDRLPREAAGKDAEIARAEAEQAALPPSADLRALKRLAREVGSDPAARANEVARNVARRSAALKDAARRVPGWTRSAEALADLRPLPLAAYERLSQTLQTAEQACSQDEAALSGLRAEADEARRRLAEVAGDGPIPDEAAVATARRTRDRGWHLIYCRAFEPGAADAAAERAWAGELPLALAYERAVAAADDLADRRGGEAARIARAAELRRQIAAAEQRSEAAATCLALNEQQRDLARLAWQDACAPLGLASGAGLPAMRDLLAGRDRVIDAVRELSVAEEARDALATEQAHLANRLAAALGIPEGEAASLGSLLARAEEAIDAETRADKARTRVQDRLSAAREERERLGQALAQTAAQQARWQTAWTDSLAALGRPPGEEAEVTRALLDTLTQLEKEQHQAAQLATRISQMQDEIAAFRVHATAAARRLAPDLADQDEFDVVRVLRARLTEQRSTLERCAALQRQLDDTDRKLADLRDKLARQRLALRAAQAVIGAETVEAARERVTLAAERARAEAMQRDAESELREKGDGFALEILRCEVAAVPADALQSACEAATRDRDAAEHALQDLAARIATGAAELDRQARETGAEAAAAEQEAAMASLGRVLDEASLLHLAAAMLDTALDVIGGASVSPVLDRIGALFCTVTGGAYEGVTADMTDDGAARLVAIERAFSHEPKQVAHLSEGTRDQLFLALRIAAIEDHAKAGAALPFVGDDILQTFDDERALAAMQALLELSRTTQVILLSHHRHLREVAARLPDGCTHICAPARVAP